MPHFQFSVQKPVLLIHTERFAHEKNIAKVRLKVYLHFFNIFSTSDIFKISI